MQYAGIGNRHIPEEIYVKFFQIAQQLGRFGFHGFSGGADGCDEAFQRGAESENHPFTVFRPKDATPEAIEIASKFHPAWHACNDYVRKLHGRNAMILLGEHLNSPRNFVICAAINEERGGTSLGIRIARHYGIPVYNIYKNHSELDELIESLRIKHGNQTET